ncbi:Na+-driven multidrug efflux pump [butyrate-producing bacterium SM4/1]|nr:Na+-driven multidrug efflux pump [butyrate-producing bacterium SM4/1]
MWGICGYFSISSSQQAVRESGLQYTHIVFLFSFGLFAEANATKLLQAKGNTVLPMLAQIAGAVLNILLDPILIYGLFGLPAMGIRGAAVATVLGQWLAMFIVILPVFRRFPVFSGRVLPADCIRIYRAGLPAIAMQSLNTLYIVGLNLVLKQFSESAVLVLGIYYKLQTFFFIPLMGLQQVILPLISFYHGAEQPQRERQVLGCSIKLSLAVMLTALGAFMIRPRRPSFHLHSRTGCPLHRLHRASDHLPQFPVRRPGNDVYRIFSERRARENQPAGDCASPGRSPGPPGLAVPL